MAKRIRYTTDFPTVLLMSSSNATYMGSTVTFADYYEDSSPMGLGWNRNYKEVPVRREEEPPALKAPGKGIGFKWGSIEIDLDDTT